MIFLGLGFSLWGVLKLLMHFLYLQIYSDFLLPESVVVIPVFWRFVRCICYVTGAYSCSCVKSLHSCLTLRDTVDLSPPESRLLCPWDSPGKNTGVGCHFLLQGNLPGPGVKLTFLSSPALAGGFFTTKPRRKSTVSNDFGQMICHGSSFKV